MGTAQAPGWGRAVWARAGQVRGWEPGRSTRAIPRWQVFLHSWAVSQHGGVPHQRRDPLLATCLHVQEVLPLLPFPGTWRTARLSHKASETSGWEGKA